LIDDRQSPLQTVNAEPPAATQAAVTALSLVNITCAFPGSRHQATYTAVKGATLHVAAGEFVVVVGPTGCGKSTLLNVAAGLLSATEGDTIVFGQRLAGLNRRAGYMFQSDALLPWRTAQDNVALGLEYRGVARAEAIERAQHGLRRVGLAVHGHRFPHQLSGGMKKRVALAQLLAVEPEILLMDEPFSALDIQTRQLMENELLQIWSESRKTVVFVTHDLEEAISLADRVVVLAAGPETRPIAEFKIDIARPRDVTEIVHSPRYLEMHGMIWRTLKDEVLRSYERSKS
jgi:NitT/TauT family transport system ATP-binding protein